MLFTAGVSYNKSKSKSSVHNESVEKSSIEAGRNMNIKSKDGSISISGADVKVGNDLSLTAKKDIDIKAAGEKFTSSSSSSQTGISLSVNLEKGRIADLSVSQAGAKGNGNGTSYVNSTIDVGGKLKTNSENLTLSGANVEADKVDIKAKNLVVESKQDKSERKDSTYGGGFSIDLANPSNFSANINGSKGNGEKDWVNKQSSLIAKNGGKIDTENLTNIGAVIGSESETNKLKVSANKVVVKDLEDKNKYENIGGGVSFGTDVPNVSVKHDKVDKEQINRVTALNTDFEVAGQKVKVEDLGFNTNKDKAQEVTKDEERHLDAELHTDLLGKDKQEELKKAGGIISDLTTALGNKGKTDALGNKGKTEGNFLERYKQLSMVRAIGDQVEKNPEYLSILDKKAIKNEKIDDDVQKEQVSVMNKLLNDALRAKGYAGPDIKMVLTDVTDPNGPFYTDTLTNVVVFDRKQLANLDRDKILNILGHEFGHYSKEDNKTGNQTIANYSGDKLEDRTKAMVSKEATKDTLASIRNNPNVITGEEGKKLAESIPMDRREYKGYGFSVGLSFSTPYGGGGGALMKGISVDDETGETYIVTVVNGSIDWSPEFSFEIGSKMSFFPNVNQPEDFEGTSLGLSISFLSVFSGEISVDLDSFKIDEASVGISKSFKEVDKAIEEAIAISPSIAKKLKPLDALKKKYNIKRDIGVSLGFGHVSDKIKVKTKDSEKLYILIKEEKILKAHLENANLTKPQKEKLKREIDLNLALQKELVKKIANIKKVKIPKVDGDIYD